MDGDSVYVKFKVLEHTQVCHLLFSITFFSLFSIVALRTLRIHLRARIYMCTLWKNKQSGDDCLVT